MPTLFNAHATLNTWVSNDGAVHAQTPSQFILKDSPMFKLGITFYQNTLRRSNAMAQAQLDNLNRAMQNAYEEDSVASSQVSELRR